MKSLMLLAATTAALALGGCQKMQEANPAGGATHRGRFAAVGLYSPGRMWRQLAAPAAAAKPAPPPDPAAATLDDDEQVIVVLDSATGELRQCGNLSGRCIAMNPWTQPIGGAPLAPATVSKHFSQLEEEYRKAHGEGGISVRSVRDD